MSNGTIRPSSSPKTFTVGRDVWELFMKELSESRKLYDTLPPDQEKEEIWRTAAGRALFATMWLLEDIGIPSSQVAPLNSLWLALCDMSDGRSNKMLQRADKGHNSSHHPYEHELRVAHAVAYIELAICYGGRSKLKDATQTMARILGISVPQMREKRRNIANGRSISAICYRHFILLVKNLKSMPSFVHKPIMECLLSDIQISKSHPRKSSLVRVEPPVALHRKPRSIPRR
jgi:hypothetical protein